MTSITIFFQDYWLFLNKQAYPHAFSTDPKDFESIENGLFSIPNLLQNMVVWTLFFTILNLLTPIVVKKLYPQWFNSLPLRKQQELAPHAVMLLHHFTAVPYGYYVIYIEYVHNFVYPYCDHIAFYGLEQYVLPFSFGMVVADTLVFALPKLFFEYNAEYILHHIVSLYIVIEFVIYKEIYIRYLPHLLICDTTNLFYCLAWLFRLHKTTCSSSSSSFLITLRDNLLTGFELLFMIAFTILRGGNLMMVFYIMYQLPVTRIALGYTRFGIVIIALLQWFWLYRIYSIAFKKLFPKKNKNLKKKKRSGDDGNQMKNDQDDDNEEEEEEEEELELHEE